MDLTERITIDPEICHGKPTIRGLRYPVETILELLSSGMTIEEILADYEDLEREDILAALAFATRLSRIKRVESTTMSMKVFWLTRNSHDRLAWSCCNRRGQESPYTSWLCRIGQCCDNRTRPSMQLSLQ